MNKIIQKYQREISYVGSGMLTVAALVVAYGTDAFANSSSSKILEGANKTGQQGGASLESGIETVTNMLLFLVGLIAVIVIIIGGIKYTTSNGDASQIKSAKDTIMYAVIGLIVAIMAYGIVRWVVNLF